MNRGLPDDDRIYTVYPYRSGKPPNTHRKSRFIIICAVIICYAVLVGIIVLIVLLSPRNPILADGRFNGTKKPGLYHGPAKPPFHPSPVDPLRPAVILNLRDYPIDPRTTAGSGIHDRRNISGKYPEGWNAWTWNQFINKVYDGDGNDKK